MKKCSRAEAELKKLLLIKKRAFGRHFYMAITVTLIPVDIVKNWLLPLFCFFV